MNPSSSIEQKNASGRCCPDFACLYESWDGLMCPECGKKCVTCSHYKDALRNKREREIQRKLLDLGSMCFLFGCNDTCPICGICEGTFNKHVKEILEYLKE